MTRAIRLVAATVVAVAVLAGPLVLDLCAAACASGHASVAEGPSCHHASESASNIGRVPVPCGHDHRAVAAAPAGSAAPMAPAFDTAATLPGARVPFVANLSDRPIHGPSPPDTSFSLVGRSLPLRV